MKKITGWILASILGFWFLFLVIDIPLTTKQGYRKKYYAYFWKGQDYFWASTHLNSVTQPEKYHYVDSLYHLYRDSSNYWLSKVDSCEGAELFEKLHIK